MTNSIDDALDTVSDLRDEVDYLAEHIADLNTEITDDLGYDGRWTHDLLDAQAYANKSKDALDAAFTLLEGLI